MRLFDIIENDYRVKPSGIGYGNNCNKGCIYFCLHGGERLNEEKKFAIANGAAIIVSEHYLEDCPVPALKVNKIREQFAEYSADYYGNPAKKLTMIGVTGTNGKTTTTHIIKSILESAGRNTGLIGTNGAYAGDKKYDTRLTTPDPPDLHRILSEMLKDGVDTVVMEVSAHAIFWGKLEGIKFAVGSFTNLTQDHLDFFGSLDKYANVKKSFFTHRNVMVGVINIDDELGMEIVRDCDIPNITYGCENPSDVFGIDYEATDRGCKFVANIMDDIIEMEYCAAGRFNMSNVLCAATIAKVLGISSATIKQGVERMKGVDGRFEVIVGDNKRVVIDYAHTPDGLEKILKAVREITKGKVITVFGCGGDRDRSKRAVMGEVASELSDFSVITSDNPRSEPPLEIMQEIAGGMHGHNFLLIEDRKEGIKKALELCQSDDTVVIAGKGHETTQERNGVKEHFSDKEVVRELLK